MGMAGFDERKVGHKHGQRRHGGVFQNLLRAYGFGGGEAAAIDVHVQEISARYHDEEPQHDGGEQGRPDAQAPTDQQQQAQSDFRERQRVRDELDSPGRQQLEGFNLEPEIGNVGGQREFQEEIRAEVSGGQKQLGAACVDKDRAEDETPDPDDDASD